jgi:hypothetical protein
VSLLTAVAPKSAYASTHQSVVKDRESRAGAVVAEVIAEAQAASS